MIPDAAVEAALISTYGNPRNGNDLVWQHMRAALEAAAPHMLAGLRELVEEMERQPRTELATVPGIAAIIRATLGDLL